MMHTFYCAWLKTQVETCVTGTLDMFRAPLRKPSLKNMSEVPVTYYAWLKTQVETCVTGTLDMSRAPLRHKALKVM